MKLVKMACGTLQTSAQLYYYIVAFFLLTEKNESFFKFFDLAAINRVRFKGKVRKNEAWST